MKTNLFVLIFLLVTTVASAQTSNITSLLQQGLLEEQANRNLDAAIVDYKTVAAEFDKDRQLAATAVFRLGECYRAQGKTNEATAQYQRILREFPDQETLATMSRQNLTGLGAAASEVGPSGNTGPSTYEGGEIQRIQRMVQDSPDLINNGELGRAVTSGELRVATLLLDHGADVNGKADGNPPLVQAAMAGQKTMVELLLKRGADVNARDGTGATAFLRATEGGFQAVVEVLLAHKADVNARYNNEVQNGLLYRGDAPLHLAVMRGYVNLIKLLLAAGANPNVENGEGQTPLTDAVGKHDALSTELLLKAGANPNQPANWTPLDAAIRGYDAASVEFLLKHGANPNEKNHSGNTPLELAKETLRQNITLDQRHLLDKIIDLLRQHGALDNPPNWDRIEVNRLSGQDPATVFRQGTNAWNRFTLLQTIFHYYVTGYEHRSPGMPPGSRPYSDTPFAHGIRSLNQRDNTMPFPDLTRVIIVRPSRDSTNATRITVNLLDSTNGIDFSKDVPLEFGDMVEITERDHSLGDTPVGLTSSQIDSIVNLLRGSVHLVVHGQKAEIPLDPIGYVSTIGTVLRQRAAERLILSSSDLSRVKVTRNDPKTGEEHEWILDCSNPSSSPDLWLRDGDVIEVPEKP